MKNKVFAWPTLVLAASLGAQAQAQSGKVAVISLQGAIVATKDGQKAASELDSKAGPKRKELEQKQNDINTLQDQLSKGQNTLSDAAKTDIYKNIEQKKKSLQRDFEDAQAEFDQEQQKILQQLTQKIIAVVERYAHDHGYTMVVDVSSPQTPVVYASPTVDITKEIIDLYDQSSAVMSNPAPAPKGSGSPVLGNPAPATRQPGTAAPAKPPATPVKPPPKPDGSK